MSKSSEKVDGKKDRSESAKESRHSAEKSASERSASAAASAPVERQIPRDPARDSALSRAVQQIEKQFGKGAVMKLDGENIQPIEGIPCDAPRREQDEGPFDAAGKVLHLRVAKRMVIIRGPGGDPQGQERENGCGEVHEGLQCI